VWAANTHGAVVYLFATLCLTACFLVGWLLRPDLRRTAVVLAPFAVLGTVFVPEYWRPDHQFTFLRGVGIEDVLFCFACGGVCWIAAAAGSGTHYRGRLQRARFVSRLCGWAVVALFGVAVAWSAGCGVLRAVVIGFTASGLMALVQAPHTSRLVVPGAAGFTAVYACVGWFVIAVCPRAAGFWVGEAITGRRVLGLPVEELVWACSFGATWPVVFGYCLGDGLVWRSWVGSVQACRAASRRTHQLSAPNPQ
jgi:hypothetical protein